MRLGIKASPNIMVHRGEVYQRILEENRAASVPDAGAVNEAGLMFSKPPEKRPSGVRRVVRAPKPEDDSE